MLVCALGDLLLDVVVRLEGVSAPGDDTPASTRVTAGGQAANVAAWAVALGAEARLIAKRGEDGAAALAAAEVAARGVELVGPVVADDGGVVVSVVDESGERSMLTDRGPSQGLRPEEIDVGWLRGCDVLHISGYALLAGSDRRSGSPGGRRRTSSGSADQCRPRDGSRDRGLRGRARPRPARATPARRDVRGRTRGGGARMRAHGHHARPQVRGERRCRRARRAPGGA